MTIRRRCVRFGLVSDSRGSSEAGATLAIALAFLTAALVLVVGLFSLANVGTTSLRSYRQERELRYAGDGGLEFGISLLTADAALGTKPIADGGTCLAGKTLAIGPVTPSSLASSSVVVISCDALADTSGADTDGGQKARIVTFEVRCYNDQANVGTRISPLKCKSEGASSRVLARARVRFDINYNLTGPGPGPGLATRAVVPKILSWDVKR